MSLSRRTACQLILAIPMAARSPVRAESPWTRCADLPASRSEMPATEMDGLIYIAGGFGAAEEANVYDPRRDSWTDLPDLAEGVNHPGITSHAGTILVGGGYSADGTEARNSIQAWQPGDSSWTTVATLPHPMGAFGFASIRDVVLLVGGALNTLNGHPTDEAWAWEPETDTWTSLAPIPRAREHLSMVARDGLAYVAGGRVHGQASPELGAALDIYDLETDGWTAGPDLAPPRSGLNGTNIAAGVVVGGGETPTDVFAEVTMLEAVSGEWIALPPLPTPVHGVAIAGVGSSLFAMGGSRTAGSIDNVKEVWRMEVPYAIPI